MILRIRNRQNFQQFEKAKSIFNLNNNIFIYYTERFGLFKVIDITVRLHRAEEIMV